MFMTLNQMNLIRCQFPNHTSVDLSQREPIVRFPHLKYPKSLYPVKLAFFFFESRLKFGPVTGEMFDKVVVCMYSVITQLVKVEVTRDQSYQGNTFCPITLHEQELLRATLGAQLKGQAFVQSRSNGQATEDGQQGYE